MYLCYWALCFIYSPVHLFVDCIFLPSSYFPVRFSPFSLLCCLHLPFPRAIGQQFLSWGRTRGSRRGQWESPAAKATNCPGVAFCSISVVACVFAQLCSPICKTAPRDLRNKGTEMKTSYYYCLHLTNAHGLRAINGSNSFYFFLI